MSDDMKALAEQVLAADAAATKGPWRVEGDGLYGHRLRSQTPHSFNSVGAPLDEICDVSGYVRNSDTEPDAALIALYRTAAPDLARAYLEAQERIRALEEALDGLVRSWDECAPHVSGAESLAYVHGWRWKGPEMGLKPALDKARAALAAAPSAAIVSEQCDVCEAFERNIADQRFSERTHRLMRADLRRHRMEDHQLDALTELASKERQGLMDLDP